MAPEIINREFTEARTFLKKCREENDRQSEKIVQVFKEVIQPSIGKLGDERWIVYEQVALASFDQRDFELSRVSLPSYRYSTYHRLHSDMAH